eukprot:TRINITY_DN20184_c0_g1_i6.p2 TRINITY_DN20184_c0_g1~~TRINITY_DN20184_c0_g1_i6.p2  ORF type:complete len:257 (+),score=48.73 TRINITY_DN20184_c0_g1_i6:89-859(+)
MKNHFKRRTSLRRASSAEEASAPSEPDPEAALAIAAAAATGSGRDDVPGSPGARSTTEWRRILDEPSGRVGRTWSARLRSLDLDVLDLFLPPKASPLPRVAGRAILAELQAREVGLPQGAPHLAVAATAGLLAELYQSAAARLQSRQQQHQADLSLVRQSIAAGLHLGCGAGGRDLDAQALLDVFGAVWRRSGSGKELRALCRLMEAATAAAGHFGDPSPAGVPRLEVDPDNAAELVLLLTRVSGYFARRSRRRLC